MAIGNAPVEAPVSVPSAQGAAVIRDLVVTLLVNGVPTPVLMQVVSLANPDGTLLDMNLASLLRTLIDQQREILCELKISNELVVRANNLNVDLDQEYRTDDTLAVAVGVAGS